MGIADYLYWDYDLKFRKSERGGMRLPGNNPTPLTTYQPEYDRMNEEQRKVWDAHFGPLNQQFLADYKAGKLSKKDITRWKYQRYMRNYLATVKAVDESVGKLLDYLDKHDLKKNTIVIYSSDQGFYLGEHGWYDKRWMFEESMAMPFIIRWPGVIQAGSKPDAMIQNIDYAPTFMEVAAGDVPDEVQGLSFLPVLKGEKKKLRGSIYYAYYELGEHNVPQHFGVRTERYKLIHFPLTDEWNMFDLKEDPKEMRSVYGDAKYADIQKELHAEYKRVREYYDAPPYHTHIPGLKKKDPLP
jgi:N-acetylglucosamine-6-sulfatase